MPFNINGNWSGELLANFPMESLRNSFQYQWESVWRESLWNSIQNQLRLVWRALGQFANLREFLSLSMEIGLGSSWSMEIGLESSWPISQWNTQGIPFKINRNCLERILMECLSKSIEIGLESSWSMFIWNSIGIPSKINGNWSGELLVLFPMEFLSKSMEIGLGSSWPIS